MSKIDGIGVQYRALIEENAVEECISKVGVVMGQYAKPIDELTREEFANLVREIGREYSRIMLNWQFLLINGERE